MSFRRFNQDSSSSFDKFASGSSEGRSMFYESTSPFRRTHWTDSYSNHFEEPSTWRTSTDFKNSGSGPDSAQAMHHPGMFSSDWPGDSIPIKVIHEKTSEKKTSDNSSEPNSSSHREGRSATHEPRVHHIPIMVEPREGTSARCVPDNRSEEIKTTKYNIGNGNAHSSLGSQSEGSSPLKKDDVYFTNDNFKSSGNNNAENPHHQPRVRHIPITVEPRTDVPQQPQMNIPKHPSPFQGFSPSNNDASQPFEGPAFSSHKTDSSNTSGQQKPSVKRPASKTGNGSHVSKIPVNVTSPPNENKINDNQSDLAMEQIAKIENEVKKLKLQVDEFSGTNQDKQYRYLDEMLTRCMLKLDDIQTDGLDIIRKARKQVINLVQECIALLESKISHLDNQPVETKAASREIKEENVFVATNNESASGNPPSSNEGMGVISEKECNNEEYKNIDTCEVNEKGDLLLNSSDSITCEDSSSNKVSMDTNQNTPTEEHVGKEGKISRKVDTAQDQTVSQEEMIVEISKMDEKVNDQEKMAVDDTTQEAEIVPTNTEFKESNDNTSEQTMEVESGDKNSNPASSELAVQESVDTELNANKRLKEETLQSGTNNE